MTNKRPLLIRLALAIVRAASWLVPGRDRDGWRREWDAEILHGHQSLARDGHASFGGQATIGRRALGSIIDAAWVRRQLTLDSELVHDFRYALRMYRRSPGMVALVVCVLAVGIGATTAVFSAAEAILLEPLPFAESHRIVTLWQSTADAQKVDVAPANFLDWRDRLKSFDVIAAAEPFSRDYTSGTEPEIFPGARVTQGFFDALRVEPQYGRLLNEDDFRLRRRVVVISDGVWKRRFGALPSLIGQSIRLDDEPFEVVGILPASFEPHVLGGRLDTWTPKSTIEDYERRSRGGGYWNVVARLRPGVTLIEAQKELEVLSAQLAIEQPGTNRDVGAWAMPMRTHLANGAERPLSLLALGAVFMLVLAMGSVANLQLGMLTGRLQEFTVRAALGARRARLVRQVVAEAATLAAIAVTLGVALAAGLLSIIRASAPDTWLAASHASLNFPVVAFACGLGLVSAMVACVLPVRSLLRSDATSRWRGELTTRSQAPAQYGRSALVVVQIAMAIVLLVSAGLLARSLARLLSVDPGITTRNLYALQVFAYDRNDTAAKRVRFFADTMNRVRALPGVESVGAASTVPFLKADIDIGSPLTIPGRVAGNPGDAPRVFLTAATPDYFRAAGISLRRGRFFTDRDDSQAPGAAIINETAMRRYWPGEDPLNRVVDVVDTGRKKTVTIVGIVADLRYGGLEGAARPEVFLPHAQSPSAAMTYVVRGGGDAVSMINAVKRAVWSIDPLQTFYDAGAVSDMVQSSVRPRVFVLRLVLAFAAIGVVLAIAGAYGAVAWALRRRTREIGVRMALGASAFDIKRQMLGYGGRLALTGIAIGLGCALVLGGLLRSFLFEVNVADPLTYLSISFALLIAVLLAASIPARRASRIDPARALRS